MTQEEKIGLVQKVLKDKLTKYSHTNIKWVPKSYEELLYSVIDLLEELNLINRIEAKYGY